MGKPAFDPSQSYSPLNEKPPFDPTKGFTPAPEEPEIGIHSFGRYLLGSGESAAENAGNTFTGNNLSNIYASVRHGIDKVLPTSMGSGLSYTQMRDMADQRLNNQSQEFPEAANVGKVSGIAGQMYGLGKLGGLIGKGAGFLTKAFAPAAEIVEAAPEAAQAVKQAPGLIKRAAVGGIKGMTGAGLMAAAENPGNVPGEVTPGQLDERLANAKKAAPWGFGLGAIGGALTGKNMSKAAAIKAEDSSFDAVRPSLRNVNQLDNAYGDPSKLQQKMREIGRTALDQEITSGKLKSSLNLSKAAYEKVQSVGKRFGDYMDTIRSVAEKDPKAPQVGVDTDEVFDFVKGKAKQKSAKLSSTIKNNEMTDEFIASTKNRAGKKLSIEDAEDLKSEADAGANWDEKDSSKLTHEEKLHRSLSTGIKKEIENSADKTFAYLQKNKPDLIPKDFSYDDFLKTKKDYGNLKWLGDVTLGRAKRDMVNRSSGITDYLSGAAGGVAAAASGHASAAVPAAVAMDLANKGIRLYGSQIAAKGLNKASGLIKNPVSMGLIAPVANKLKSYGDE